MADNHLQRSMLAVLDAAYAWRYAIVTPGASIDRASQELAEAVDDWDAARPHGENGPTAEREVIDGWTIEGDRAWRLGDGLPGGVIERTADEIRARNLLWRAAGLAAELEYRRLGPLRPAWHCSGETFDLIRRQVTADYISTTGVLSGLPLMMFGLPVVVDESPELHIEIALPERNDR